MFEMEARLYRFTHGYVKLLVGDIPDEALVSQPAGMTLNHPAWILGHLAGGADYACQLLGQASTFPPDWAAKFGPGSKVVNERSSYPSKDALLEALDRDVARVLEAVSRADPDALTRPHGLPLAFLKGQIDTAGEMLAHLMTTHQAVHAGQLSAWRRAMNRPGVLSL